MSTETIELTTASTIEIVEVVGLSTTFVYSTQKTIAAGSNTIELGDADSYRSFILDGVIDDGTNYNAIHCVVIHNGTIAEPFLSRTNWPARIDGLTFTADISSGTVRLVIVNSGTAVTMVYGIQPRIAVST